jgi:hypothetical protein
MLEALVAGQGDVTALANLARGRLRSKQAEVEQALRGRLEPHHAFMLAQHLALIDVFDEQAAAETPSAPEGAWAAQAIVDAIPGIGERVT